MGRLSVMLSIPCNIITILAHRLCRINHLSCPVAKLMDKGDSGDLVYFEFAKAIYSTNHTLLYLNSRYTLYSKCKWSYKYLSFQPQMCCNTMDYLIFISWCQRWIYPRIRAFAFPFPQIHLNLFDLLSISFL